MVNPKKHIPLVEKMEKGMRKTKAAARAAMYIPGAGAAAAAKAVKTARKALKK